MICLLSLGGGDVALSIICQTVFRPPEFWKRALACSRQRHNEDPPGGDWFLACEIRLPFSPINWRPRTRRIRAIRVESELRLTARESRSPGSGASLDVRESSRLTKTLLPGA